jgi:hypothetical protein
MNIKIQSISFKTDLPTVRFSQLKAEDERIDSIYPGKGSGDILPSVAFANAIDRFVESLLSLDLPDGDWRLSKLTLLWDKGSDDDYGFSAEVKQYNPEKQYSAALTIKQDSPDNVDPVVRAALSQIVEQAIKFVGGESAQGNLLELPMNEEAA